MHYVILFILSALLTYFVRLISLRKELLDHVNERSSHQVPTPHGGGIAIAITWFGGLFYLFANDHIDHRLFYALLPGIFLAVISYLDDLFDLPPRVRLLVQTLTALLGLYALGGVDSLHFFFFETTSPLFNNMFAFLMIIWFINLYNFLDGIDGYAGTEAVFLGISGYVLFGGDHFLVLVASASGFLVWNWHKAKIFMGDVGSTLLGYTVAIFALYYTHLSPPNLWIWVTLFSLFWIDATLTLWRRYRNGERLSQAHRKHAYQRLNRSGWRADKVVQGAMVINLLLLLFTLLIPSPLFMTAASIILVYSVIRYIDTKFSFHESML